MSMTGYIIKFLKDGFQLSTPLLKEHTTDAENVFTFSGKYALKKKVKK